MSFTFEFWNFFSGLIAGGLGGSLMTITLSKTMKSDRGGSTVDQSGSSAGNDIVGRDKK